MSSEHLAEFKGRVLEQLANNSQTRITWSRDDYTLMAAFLAWHKITKAAELEVHNDDLVHLAWDLGFDKEKHPEEKHWVAVRRRIQSSMRYQLEEMKKARQLRKGLNADKTLEVWEWPHDRRKQCIANARLLLKGRQEGGALGSQDKGDQGPDGDQGDGASIGYEQEMDIDTGESAAGGGRGLEAAVVDHTWGAFQESSRRRTCRQKQDEEAKGTPTVISISSDSSHRSESSTHGWIRDDKENGQDAPGRQHAPVWIRDPNESGQHALGRQRATVSSHGEDRAKGIDRGNGDVPGQDDVRGDSDSDSDDDSDDDSNDDVDGDARADEETATRILQLRHRLIDGAIEDRLRRLGLGADNAGGDGISGGAGRRKLDLEAAHERQTQRWEALEEAMRELPTDDIWRVGGSWELLVRATESIDY